MLVITRRNESAFGPVQRELFCGEINKFESPSLRSYLSHHTLPRPRIHQRNPCSRQRRSGDAVHHHSSDFVSGTQPIAVRRRALRNSDPRAQAKGQQRQRGNRPDFRFARPPPALHACGFHGSLTSVNGEGSRSVCAAESSTTMPFDSYLRSNSALVGPISVFRRSNARMRYVPGAICFSSNIPFCQTWVCRNCPAFSLSGKK